MPKRILVIDDEELIIKSLSKLLEKNGYEVFITKNSQDALVLTEEEDFDLILADIRMPGINGVDAVEQIYNDKARGKSKKIPVIFITGYADDKIEAKAKTLGPVAYIYKPFGAKELLEQISRVIG